MLPSALEEDGELSHQACTRVVVDKTGSHDRETAAEHESYADDDESKYDDYPKKSGCRSYLREVIGDGTAG